MKVIVDPIFAGPTQPMPATGRPTGMFKAPIRERVQIGLAGIVGDGVGDRRLHGGPEKAIHQFPMEHYAQLASIYPDEARDFVAGSVGENLSTLGMDETTVCIGDVFTFGNARLQVNQPRTPCAKLEQRFGIDDLAQFIAYRGCAGWYFRVLQTGTAQAGDVLELIARNPDPVSLREIWELGWNHRPQMARMQRIIDTPGLAPELRARLVKRADWLRVNAG